MDSQVLQIANCDVEDSLINYDIAAVTEVRVSGSKASCSDSNAGVLVIIV